MKKIILIILGSSVAFSLCAQKKNSNSPMIKPSIICKDIKSWLVYERDYIKWSSEFISLDSALTRISKEIFLQQMTTGRYLPLRLENKGDSIVYQLYHLDSTVSNDIVETVKNKAMTCYHFFKMEGLPLPNYNFFDLDGNIYDKNTMNGKLLVIKCWFISCIPCIAEMPKLNDMVSQYKDRDDIVFLGLAFDKVKELQIFLKKTKFKYQVVADKEDYMRNILEISGYPTHLLVNKQGIIKKVSDSYEDIQAAINIEMSK